jgi:hypothetical protein
MKQIYKFCSLSNKITTQTWDIKSSFYTSNSNYILMKPLYIDHILKTYFLGPVGFVNNKNDKLPYLEQNTDFLYNGYVGFISNHVFDEECMHYLKSNKTSVENHTKGNVVFSFGGENVAFESRIEDTKELKNLYSKIITEYNLSALDFRFNEELLSDSKTLDRHVETINQIIQKHPELKLSYTLNVGLANQESNGFGNGKILLQKLQNAGITPNLINGFAAELGTKANTNLVKDTKLVAKNMNEEIATIFTELNPDKIWQHMGICPTIGINNHGKIFTVNDLKQLSHWAQEINLGCLNAWHMSKDFYPEAYDLGIENHQFGSFSQVLHEHEISMEQKLAGELDNIDNIVE